VSVKVFSGDNAASVGAVAGALGLPGADRPVDARRMQSDPSTLADALSASSVFGRVTPQQKRTFVEALRARGHVVAMTGDGVNDALALKTADLGIAMGSGTPATRGVAKIVLLDDDFAVLPHVLAEGRRVLGNIERVAGLFLVKTTYSVLLALLVGVAHLPFPLLPRHVTLIGTLTIGIPGFFLALAPNAERARPGFVRRVLRFAVPGGLACALATFAAYGLALRAPASDLPADRTAAALALFVAAFGALALVSRPYTWWRLLLLMAVVAAFVVVAVVPFTAGFFALTFSVWDDGCAVLAGLVAGAVMVGVDRWHLSRRILTSADGGHGRRVWPSGKRLPGMYLRPGGPEAESRCADAAGVRRHVGEQDPTQAAGSRGRER
jgi:cation-transporting ATPase E